MTEHAASYKVRVADAGADGFLKLPSLLQMLQEAATEHAEILGVDFKTLKPAGLGWALSKIYVEIERLPKWGERVGIKTWASDRDSIATYREFEAFSSGGRPLFTARSQWLLFDFRSRRLARMDRIGDFARIPGRRANSEDFSERPKAPSPESPHAISRDAGICDIDLNGHVNNSVYMAWALDALPDMPQKFPRRLSISFLEEVRPHAEIRSVCEISGNISSHSIFSADTGRECARANVEWASQ